MCVSVSVSVLLYVCVFECVCWVSVCLYVRVYGCACICVGGCMGVHVCLRLGACVSVQRKRSGKYKFVH